MLGWLHSRSRRWTGRSPKGCTSRFILFAPGSNHSFVDGPLTRVAPLRESWLPAREDAMGSLDCSERGGAGETLFYGGGGLCRHPLSTSPPTSMWLCELGPPCGPAANPNPQHRIRIGRTCRPHQVGSCWFLGGRIRRCRGWSNHRNQEVEQRSGSGQLRRRLQDGDFRRIPVGETRRGLVGENRRVSIG